MNLDLIEASWRLRMTYGTDRLSGSVLGRWHKAACQLRAGVPLQRFKFERSVGSPQVYDYRIWLLDGRIWQQDVTFMSANDTNPSMTFSVPAGWKLSEFAAHREWRDLMVEVRNSMDATLVRLDPS